MSLIRRRTRKLTCSQVIQTSRALFISQLFDVCRQVTSVCTERIVPVCDERYRQQKYAAVFAGRSNNYFAACETRLLYEIAPVITGTELSTWYESPFVPRRAVEINYDWNWVVSRLAFVIFWLKISRSRVPRGLTDVDKLNKSFVAHPCAKCHSHASLFHEIPLSFFLFLFPCVSWHTHARASVSICQITFIALKYVITRLFFSFFQPRSC